MSCDYFQLFLMITGIIFWQYVLLRIGFKIIDKYFLKESEDEN
jgi:hypothetical protein